jgi:hypothetical protein
MIRSITIAAVALLTVCSTAEGQVTLFEHTDFYGTARTFERDVRDLRRSGFPNDAASSVVVEPGCTAWLYSDRDFRGRETVITSRQRDRRRGQGESISDLGRTSVGNDRVSSIVVRCQHNREHDYQRSRVDHRERRLSSSSRSSYEVASSAVLYSDAGFRGRSLAIDYQIEDLGRTRIGNDRLSSIQVAPGCRAIVFEDVDFRGRSVVVRHGSADLGRTAIGNDRASSIIVECR